MMNQYDEQMLDVRRGSSRVRTVWLSPTPAGVAPNPVPASAGRWVEKAQNTFARQKVTVPVIVGSTLRMF